MRRLNGYSLSDKGKVRSHNEDSVGLFVNSNRQQLAVIADGMGGHNAGDVASGMVSSLLKEKWHESEKINLPENAESWLLQTIVDINNKVFAYAQDHSECAGMGTTVVAAICTNDFVTIAHIGDSRCYLYNEQGFKQITEDHSLVNELVRSGQISKDDAEYHPRKNVLLKALGTELDVQADVQTIGWEKGDKLLLCSDGLSNKVTDVELEDFLSDSRSLEDLAVALVHLANDRGGEDNISLALLHYMVDQEEGEL